MFKKGALILIILIGCLKPVSVQAPIQDINVEGESGALPVARVNIEASKWNIEISDYASNVGVQISENDLPKDSETPVFKTDRWLCYLTLDQPTSFQNIITVTCIGQTSYAYIHTRGVGCLTGERDAMDKEYQDLVVHVDCNQKQEK